MNYYRVNSEKKNSPLFSTITPRTSFRFCSLVLVIGIIVLMSLIRPKSVLSATKPNILWITSEDNGPFIGCYGDPYADTPNINALAGAAAIDGSKEGIYFLNAVANAPVCAPSRCSIITGMTANTLGTDNHRSQYALPSFVELFPKYLKDNGYYTYNNSKTITTSKMKALM